jgi:talin
MTVQNNIAESTPASKAAVQKDAKAVADSVNNVIDAAGLLVPAGYVDPNDPNVIAERELLSAANMIEAAAKKLASFKPPIQANEADDNLDFSAQIMEAAKAIAAASGALIRSATVSQREILAKGKGGTSREQMYFSDGSWSEGLVSAARAVAAATGELCDSANQTLKGLVPREHIIISARNVSAATQRLMAAATTKSDVSSTNQIRLKAASKAVLSASDSLVKAAEQSAAFQDTDSVAELLSGSASATQGKVKEMEAQMSVLKMEKDLEMARNRLAGLRKNKYQS